MHKTIYSAALCGGAGQGNLDQPPLLPPQLHDERAWPLKPVLPHIHNDFLSQRQPALDMDTGRLVSAREPGPQSLPRQVESGAATVKQSIEGELTSGTAANQATTTARWSPKPLGKKTEAAFMICACFIFIIYLFILLFSERNHFVQRTTRVFCLLH